MSFTASGEAAVALTDPAGSADLPARREGSTWRGEGSARGGVLGLRDAPQPATRPPHPRPDRAARQCLRRRGLRRGRGGPDAPGVAAGVARHAAPRPARRATARSRGWGPCRPRRAGPRVALSGGGSLARPPGWRQVAGDGGSVSFARLDRDGAIGGYLNATPRSGAETLANWTRFRPAHNAAEGDRNVRELAGARSLRVGAAPASCVTDVYATSSSRYREVACIVAGTHAGAGAVVVGAARPAEWSREAPAIERAIAGFVTG